MLTRVPTLLPVSVRRTSSTTFTRESHDCLYSCFCPSPTTRFCRFVIFVSASRNYCSRLPRRRVLRPHLRPHVSSTSTSTPSTVSTPGKREGATSPDRTTNSSFSSNSSPVSWNSSRIGRKERGGIVSPTVSVMCVQVYVQVCVSSVIHSGIPSVFVFVFLCYWRPDAIALLSS